MYYLPSINSVKIFYRLLDIWWIKDCIVLRFDTIADLYQKLIYQFQLYFASNLGSIFRVVNDNQTVFHNFNSFNLQTDASSICPCVAIWDRYVDMR